MGHGLELHAFSEPIISLVRHLLDTPNFVTMVGKNFCQGIQTLDLIPIGPVIDNFLVFQYVAGSQKRVLALIHPKFL